LDWILKQKDLALIQSTLSQLTKHKPLSQLFSCLLAKFQSERPPSDQIALYYWLSVLLKLHWMQLVKHATPHDLHNMASIQNYISQKTNSLPQLIQLQGKVTMVEQTL